MKIQPIPCRAWLRSSIPSVVTLAALALIASPLALIASSHLPGGAPHRAWTQGTQTGGYESGFAERVVAAAVERTHHTVRYDPAYVRIPYPGGDVPADTGVCTDEVIRVYRAVGIDLQREVHEDMLANPAAYPRKWSIRAGSLTDSNIDHRRVPNLMAFFSRHGESLPMTRNAGDYRPGEVVAWNLGGGVTHIGIVVDQKAPQSGRYLIVHNIGSGPQMEDVLFSWKVIGHYRYLGRGGI